MARVRSKANALARLLADCPCPVFALNDQREIVYCNTACGELVGLEPDQLIGQRCDYQAARGGTMPTDVAASLCPPLEALHGNAVSGEVTIVHHSGKLVALWAEYLPLGGDQLQCVGVLAVLYEPGSHVDDRVRRDSESAGLHRQLATLRRQLVATSPLDELVGVSPPIQRVRDQIRLAARGRIRVVVQGPAGSGREHVARHIHRQAMPDSAGPLIPLCCPLLDAELLQSTIKALVRQFDAATRETAPTLLLMDVDQLQPEAQSELAGFLSLPGFELYVVATAERSLFSRAGNESFRSDLAHALSTLVIEMPPLAERRADIPLLCQFFLEKYNATGGRQLSGFSPAALDDLTGYPWPENVDELAEVVEQACQAAEGPFVECQDLPVEIRWSSSPELHPRRVEEPIVLDDFLADVEQELIERAVRQAKGNKTKAARLLGITRARLHRRLDQLHGKQDEGPVVKRQ